MESIKTKKYLIAFKLVFWINSLTKTSKFTYLIIINNSLYSKGLDLQISDKGRNLSRGERALICMCREILNKK